LQIGNLEAIREAQALVPGYTYEGFCAKVAASTQMFLVGSLCSKPVQDIVRRGWRGKPNVSSSGLA
jgi:hypothetical protein